MTSRTLVVLCAMVASVITTTPAFAQDDSAAEVTFTKDVAPILQRSCQMPLGRRISGTMAITT